MQSESRWRHLTEGGTTYVLKRTHDKGAVKFVVSDLVHVWVHMSTEGEILHLFQDMNPLIELNDEAIVHNIWAIVDAYIELEEHEESVSSIHLKLIEEDTLQLNFKTIMEGLAFKFDLKLVKENSLTFFHEVTSPILAVAKELLARQDLLCSLLQKKDLEISQYKLEGATLSRRNVETETFSKADFINKHLLNESNSCKGVLKVSDILNLLFKRDLISSSDATPVSVLTCSKESGPVCPQASSETEPCQSFSAGSHQSELLTKSIDCTLDEKPKVEARVLKLQKKKPKLNL